MSAVRVEQLQPLTQGPSLQRPTTIGSPAFPEDNVQLLLPMPLPTAMAGAQAQPVVGSGPGLSVPTRAPLSAIDILNDWVEEAAFLEAAAFDRGDVKAYQVMAGAQKIMRRVGAKISLERADHAFALTAGGRDKVQVIALVNFQDFMEMDESSSPIAKTVMQVEEMVVTPFGRCRGVGPELYRQLKAWAKDHDYLLSVAPIRDEDREYYKSVGFRLVDFFFQDGATAEVLPGGQTCEMVTLDLAIPEKRLFI